MKPSVVLLGFVLGSVGSIAFGLMGVVVIFLFLRAGHPRMQVEFTSLIGSFGVFLALTLLAALSFYGQMKEAAWRRPAVGLLLVSLVGVGWSFWPK